MGSQPLTPKEVEFKADGWRVALEPILGYAERHRGGGRDPSGASYCQPHPRTADRMARLDLKRGSDRVRLLRPLGFFDIAKHERHARCIISDSGTVQEECCIFGVPNVTIRDVTERPETIECGSNVLTGEDPDMILRAVDIVLNSPSGWSPPPEYLQAQVSKSVAKIVLGYRVSRSVW